MTKKFVWIFNICVIIIFAIILTDFFGIVGSKNSVKLEINEGDGISAVADRLKRNNIVISKNLFLLYCKIGDSDIKLQPGEFEVNSGMSYPKLVNAIEQSSDSSYSVTIPEGFETREIADRLLSNDVIKNENEFFDALKKYSFTLDDGTVINGAENSLNGFLFPDTYNFYKSTDPTEIIKAMTDNFKKHWLDDYSKRAKKLDMSVEEIVTLASIIEREGDNSDDFKLVSSVFHNRLKNNMKLESCATVQYILSERKPVLSVADTKIKSPYNTYLNEGLPPTAISSPGVMAIEAALYPEESDYLFFFTDKNGETHFTKSLEEHNKLINEYGL